MALIPDATDIVMSFDKLDFCECSTIETVAERYEPAWSSTDDEEVLWLESLDPRSNVQC